MHQPFETRERETWNAEAMRHLVMRTFVELLRETNLPPMLVLEYAAAAVGAAYRDVATAHRPPNVCPCGWRPDEMADIATLQMAMAREALSDAQFALAVAPVMGHA